MYGFPVGGGVWGLQASLYKAIEKVQLSREDHFSGKHKA